MVNEADKRLLILALTLLLPICFLGIIFVYAELKLLPDLMSFVVPPEYVSGIISANGIIIGFWAAIIGLSYREHPLVLKKIDVIEFTFFLSLSLLIFTVALFAFQALGLIASFSVLTISVITFYLTCFCLGITLHYSIFKRV
jgi:hypothetical protein